MPCSHSKKIAVLAKLIAEKETFVHERLWPELVSVGAARARWQEEGLTPNARELLSPVSRARHPKPAKELAPDMEAKVRLKAVRLLEVRLLVHSDERHTETGAHAKFLQTWRGFARERDVNRRPGPTQARGAFETIVNGWSAPRIETTAPLAELISSRSIDFACRHMDGGWQLGTHGCSIRHLHPSLTVPLEKWDPLVTVLVLGGGYGPHPLTFRRADRRGDSRLDRLLRTRARHAVRGDRRCGGRRLGRHR